MRPLTNLDTRVTPIAKDNSQTCRAIVTAMNDVTERELRRLIALYVTDVDDAVAYYDNWWRLVGIGPPPRYGEQGQIVLRADHTIYRPFTHLLEVEPAGCA